MAGDSPIIVKRIKRGGHGGHHGGAWKVAYADFVTAMMAFFLLLWLINTTTPEQKRGIADYFAAQSISQTVSGAGGILGGRVLGELNAKAGGTPSVIKSQAPPASPNTTQTRDPSTKKGGMTDAKGATPESQVTSDDHLEQSVPAREKEDFASAAESIRQAMQDSPDIAQLSKQVLVDQTPEGLRIQLVDQDGRPMFEPGTAHLVPQAKKVLAAVARIIDRLPNRVSISGHTDGKAFIAADGSTGWELSAARANVARATLAGAGLSSDRIYEVAGKAGSEPLLPEDPNASANRRLSIVLMHEAPPTPASPGL